MVHIKLSVAFLLAVAALEPAVALPVPGLIGSLITAILRKQPIITVTPPHDPGQKGEPPVTEFTPKSRSERVKAVFGQWIDKRPKIKY